jgi:hypothetical protein
MMASLQVFCDAHIVFGVVCRSIELPRNFFAGKELLSVAVSRRNWMLDFWFFFCLPCLCWFCFTMCLSVMWMLYRRGSYISSHGSSSTEAFWQGRNCFLVGLGEVVLDVWCLVYVFVYLVCDGFVSVCVCVCLSLVGGALTSLVMCHHQQVLKTPYYRNCKSARNIRRGMSFEKEPSKAVRATEGPGHCIHLFFISYCFSSA